MCLELWLIWSMTFCAKLEGMKSQGLYTHACERADTQLGIADMHDSSEEFELAQIASSNTDLAHCIFTMMHCSYASF